MEYHKTKDPLYVKELLGHKKLDTTLLYIQIEKHYSKIAIQTNLLSKSPKHQRKFNHF
jgi:site-specific recombinase XerC